MDSKILFQIKRALISSLIAGTLFVVPTLFVLTALSEKTAKPIPRLHQLRGIGLNSYDTGWSARLFPNGSASFGYGASGGDWAEIPEGSFSFEEIYTLLVPRLKQKGNITESASVALWTEGQTSTSALYFDDKEVLRKIMHNLCDKTVPIWKDRFEHLLREYPLVPGDPPYLK